MNHLPTQPTPVDAQYPPMSQPDLYYSPDDLFAIDPRPCIPIFFPDHLIKPTGTIPASRIPSLPKDPRMYARVSLREALAWCAAISGRPISVANVEDVMWKHGLVESDTFVKSSTYRHSGFTVYDDQERSRRITKVSAELLGIAYNPVEGLYSEQLFLRLPPRYVEEGHTRDFAEVLDWACQTWGLLGTPRDADCRAFIAKARGVRYPVDQFGDGTFEVPRLSLPAWRGFGSLFLPKPPQVDLPF